MAGLIEGPFGWWGRGLALGAIPGGLCAAQTTWVVNNDPLAPAEGLARAGARGAHDRIEQSGSDFHDRVARAFVTYLTDEWQAAHPECGPIVRIDARGDERMVFERIVNALATRWPESFAV